MIPSLALIILVGLAMASIAAKLRIPRIIGFLLTGIVLGPYVLDLLDPAILNISSELRQIALIIILIKAGLSLNIADLKKVGRPAVLLAFVPASFEMLAYTMFAPGILGVSRIDAAVMGAVLSAVSPAVVVPRMVNLMEKHYGTDKSIPQMILAGTSCDDIFVIVLFSTFLHMAQGEAVQMADFMDIPVSIGLGILMGITAGYLISMFFEMAYARKQYIRNSMKIIVIMGAAFLLMSVEIWLDGMVAVSGLLAVVSMACVIKIKSIALVSKRLSEKMGKLWLAAEILLFVLVGAAVDIRYAVQAGIGAVAMIALALAIRSVGVLVCLIKTNLNWKERLFCVIAYLPKATVQAAIGSVPLAVGLGCGQTVLTVAVLGILITAPLGAIGIDGTYRRVLKRG